MGRSVYAPFDDALLNRRGRVKMDETRRSVQLDVDDVGEDGSEAGSAELRPTTLFSETEGAIAGKYWRYGPLKV
jgi:hypothetical protein